ncbi:AraC family transcriptional regulator [Fulvivirga sp. M361]|uniref:AraC family transcriptional regulator n=1 Tax=Fulvivirga sp. M361 TaxID=2594266 RepID=UPI001179C439|nr:AraC family transcriptional regulator [Fulvivirga sp. M361]TRX60626.1 AraC family transcriptional regulator [Fulvivirga sp. M361]
MKAVFEKVYSGDEEAITAFIYEDKTFNAPWHYHPEYELTLILKGIGMRYVGNDVSAYAPGDMVLLGTGLPHCWRTSASSNGAKSVVIQWQGSALPKIPEFNAIHHLLTLSQRGVRFSEDLKEVFLQLVLTREPFLRFTRFISLLHQLTQSKNYQLLASASYQIDTSKRTNDRLDLIHQYLSAHFQERITLAQMATLLSMTNESFSRFFSKRMQKPFFSFLNEYRVNRAGRLLIETDQQVAEIGYSCGYESLPFFFKQFKKYKGYSPLDFRKRYREQVGG